MSCSAPVICTIPPTCWTVLQTTVEDGQQTWSWKQRQHVPNLPQEHLDYSCIASMNADSHSVKYWCFEWVVWLSGDPGNPLVFDYLKITFCTLTFLCWNWVTFQLWNIWKNIFICQVNETCEMMRPHWCLLWESNCTSVSKEFRGWWVAPSGPAPLFSITLFLHLLHYLPPHPYSQVQMVPTQRCSQLASFIYLWTLAIHEAHQMESGAISVLRVHQHERAHT